jgi:hypothetical protein
MLLERWQQKSKPGTLEAGEKRINLITGNGWHDADGMKGGKGVKLCG